MTVQRRRGFALIEMMVILVVLAAALTASMLMLVAAIRTEQMAKRTHDAIARQEAIAERFRDDVRRAVAVPSEWFESAAGPQCLILELPGRQFVAYSFRDGLLFRETCETSISLPLPKKNCSVEFVRNGKLITLRIVEKADREARPAYEIIAALGGTRP